ncbi:MAG: Stp1/IreP family PP2C-type Ser/Thr phosphatase [Clostridia bacterium]|nr:Stp1/IreP family PP2C-type Ser/Thr phosphatase [Clostridia bacterium]
MFVEVCGLTDVGQMRELNEDSFEIRGFKDGKPLGVCVLADGMGGHNAGEVASHLAVQLICDDLESTLSEGDSDAIVRNMAAAIDFANSEIYSMSLKNPNQAGMGTTTVIALVKENLVRIANIGDSCAYLVSDTVMRKITIDHSVVEELVQSGSITRAEARNHPDKNIITRAVGTEQYVDADFFDYVPVGGEIILMCSDGLCEMVRDKDIKRIINDSENISAAVKALIDEANKNGGVDNITVVALQFKKEENI